MPILALVSDLLFESKILATAQQLGIPVRVLRNPEGMPALLTQASGLIVDLNLPTGDALQVVRDAKAARPGLPIVAFLSHVQTELRREAQSAGADEVLPRSKFAAELPRILQGLHASPPPP